LIRRLAEDDPDGRLVIPMAEGVIDSGQVEVHLPGVLRLETNESMPRP